MIKISADITSVAYHEAAHAVATFEFGKRIRKVTIVPNDDSLGRCIGYYKLPPLDGSVNITPSIANKVQQHIIIDFVGMLAEQRLFGKKPRNWLKLTDISNAMDLAMYMNGREEEVNSYLEWLFERAKSMIYERELSWMAIQAIAEELLKKRTLSGKEAYEIWDNVYMSAH